MEDFYKWLYIKYKITKEQYEDFDTDKQHKYFKKFMKDNNIYWVK